MYLQFYGFKEAPFNLTPDSKFLFLSHRHQEALAALLFGVQERKGFIAMTGDIGCGKTTLCRAVLGQLDPAQTKTCIVLNSYLTDLELLKTINEGFTLPAESNSKKELLDRLNDFLIDQFSQGHNVVLVIDESQNLRPETLEQIRMISNLETETAKLIQIVLIGQPELARTLALPELEQLNQRITVRYHITPLEEKEIPDYIKHRLAIAEPQVEVSFTPQAHKLIYHFSRGVPRRINVICDRCLLVGYIEGTFNIDEKLVQRAVTEVRGDVQGLGPVTMGGTMESAKASGKKMLLKLAKGLAALLIIAGGVYFGLSMALKSSNDMEADRQRLVAAASLKNDTVKGGIKYPLNSGDLLDVTQGPGKGKAGAGGTAATPVPTPTATPKPTPTPILYDNWQYDTENILRVRKPELSEAAAYLNVMRRWNLDVDLEPFRTASPTDVASYDMLEMVKPLNFRALRSDTLSDALRMDLPVLVRLEGQNDLAPWGVIVSMRGEMLELLDPIHGKRMLRRQKLEPLVKEATVLFQDPLGLMELTPGMTGDRVSKLQAWLLKEDCFKGKLDGKYGQDTREAIEALQRREGIKETGRLDAPTAVFISARLNSHRPRLYS